MDQISPYDFIEQVITVMTNIVQHQLSSPQLQEFIRSAELPILIAYHNIGVLV
jgi:hypothetical protein